MRLMPFYKLIADDEAENAVAEKFELLVVRLKMPGSGFGGVGTVGQGAAQQITIPKLVTELRFEFSEIRAHSRRGGYFAGAGVVAGATGAVVGAGVVVAGAAGVVAAAPAGFAPPFSFTAVFRCSVAAALICG